MQHPLNKATVIGPGFMCRRVATSGCEILNQDGQVVAWAIDEWWAGVIVALLNHCVERNPDVEQ